MADNFEGLGEKILKPQKIVYMTFLKKLTIMIFSTGEGMYKLFIACK